MKKTTKHKTGKGKFNGIDDLNKKLKEQEERKAKLPKTEFKPITYTNENSKYVKQMKEQREKLKKDREDFFKQQEELHQKINEDYRNSDEGQSYMHLRQIMKTLTKYMGEKQMKYFPFYSHQNDTKMINEIYENLPAMKEVMNNTFKNYLAKLDYDVDVEDENEIFEKKAEVEKDVFLNNLCIYIDFRHPNKTIYEWTSERQRSFYDAIRILIKMEFDKDVSEYDIPQLDSIYKKMAESGQYDFSWTFDEDKQKYHLTFAKAKSASEEINEALPFLKPMNDVLNIIAKPVFGVDANEATDMGINLGSTVGSGIFSDIKETILKMLKSYETPQQKKTKEVIKEWQRKYDEDKKHETSHTKNMLNGSKVYKGKGAGKPKKLKVKELKEQIKLHGGKNYGKLKKKDLVIMHQQLLQGEGFFSDLKDKIKGVFSLKQNQFNNVSKKTLEKYGNSIILEMKLIRTQFLTSDKIKNLLKTVSGHDRVFHLSSIVKVKDEEGLYRWISIHKRNQVMVELGSASNLTKDAQTLDIDLHGKQLTINELLKNCLDSMGTTRFFSYRVSSWNCQHFIMELLKASSLLDEKDKDFIYQDLITMRESFPLIDKAFNGLTDLKTLIDEKMGKGKNKKHLEGEGIFDVIKTGAKEFIKSDIGKDLIKQGVRKGLEYGLNKLSDVSDNKIFQGALNLAKDNVKHADKGVDKVFGKLFGNGKTKVLTKKQIIEILKKQPKKHLLKIAGKQKDTKASIINMINAMSKKELVSKLI